MVTMPNRIASEERLNALLPIAKRPSLNHLIEPVAMLLLLYVTNSPRTTNVDLFPLSSS